MGWLLKKPWALPMRMFEDADSKAYTWEDWRDDAKRNHPIKYWLQEELHWYPKKLIIWPIRRVYWWVRYRTFDRYHILNIGSPGYKDADTIMMEANFTILVGFMESKYQNTCWECSPDQVEAKARLDSLYNWWKYERPHRKEHDPDKEYMWTYNQDNEKLQELFNLRKYLWD